MGKSAASITSNRVDVVVIGAGIIGAAASSEIAGRGRSVVLLEQYELGHSMGSSHGKSRIFRLGYEQPLYVRLAQEARIGWSRLEREVGRKLLRPVGALDIGHPDSLDPIEAALEESHAPSERVAAASTSRWTDGLIVPEGLEVLFQPDGGVLLAEACYQAFLAQASARGAAVKPNTRVLSLESNSDSVTVHTSDGAYVAACAVVTAAGWTNQLSEPLGISVPIRVTRETVAYYPGDFSRFRLPFIWHQADPEPLVYGLPNNASGTLKIGRHQAGPEVVAGSEGVVEECQVALIDEFVDANIQGVDHHPSRAETCLYAATPDDDFVIDRLGPIVLGVGFGGHGFKFAPAVGGMLADLVEGKPMLHADEFNLSRFSGEAANA